MRVPTDPRTHARAHGRMHARAHACMGARLPVMCWPRTLIARLVGPFSFGQYMSLMKPPSTDETCE
jgi:hypothetical protein